MKRTEVSEPWVHTPRASPKPSSHCLCRRPRRWRRRPLSLRWRPRPTRLHLQAGYRSVGDGSSVGWLPGRTHRCSTGGSSTCHGSCCQPGCGPCRCGKCGTDGDSNGRAGTNDLDSPHLPVPYLVRQALLPRQSELSRLEPRILLSHQWDTSSAEVILLESLKTQASDVSKDAAVSADGWFCQETSTTSAWRPDSDPFQHCVWAHDPRGWICSSG